MRPPKVEYHWVEDHRGDHFRSGEGAAIELSDGRLLMAYTAFRSSSSADHAAADIRARFSDDEGRSWSEHFIMFCPPEGALNIMSPSLLRLEDGRIACTFAIKWTATHCVPQWTTSSDEGKTWTKPAPITLDEGYFVVNNDRLVQLRDGTILLPYALHRGITRNADDKELLKEWLNAWCGIFYSTDGGANWCRPDNARRYEKQWYAEPSPLCLETMAPVEREAVRQKYDVFQEPGVVELRDGRLMMWVRSLSHIYTAVSSRKEGEWSEFSSIQGINVSCSPQTIKRMPSTGDLVMLYNDRGDVPFGSPTFQCRTPLSVAVSQDEGQTWVKRAPLEEDQSQSYCYFGLLFFTDRFLVMYYESAQARDEKGEMKYLADGTPQRRNLASLKLCIGEQSELIR